MVMNYTDHYNKRKTSQRQPVPGKKMKKNNAGGYAFKLDHWDQLDRFLILGTEGGTFHVNERKLTEKNCKALEKCLKEDGTRTVERIAQISESGRAPKNDPALFALAVACADNSLATRQAAFRALPRVARIGTHLFHFLEYVKAFRGWGRGLKNAVGAWYQGKPARKLALQAVKYKQRDGWSHADALRLSKPVPVDEAHKAIYQFMTKGTLISGSEARNELRLIEGHLKAHKAKNAREVVKLIGEYNLPREAIPTQFLKTPEVWEAMLPGMPITALIRNLGNLSKCGLLVPLSDAENLVVSKLTDEEALRRGRVHPIQVLIALKTYASGRGLRGSGNWTVSQAAVDALDEAFYKTFDTIEPTGKRWLLGVDVSGSMGWGTIAGVAGLQPRHGAAAMSMVAARTEKFSHIMGFSHQFVDLGISKKDRLDTVLNKTARVPMGGTDCALPMIWAAQNKVKADVFAVYTDNETWAGKIHPFQALKEYRQKMGIDAKLIVVGMVSNGFSIADPSDPGMLDVVGFDAGAPAIMNTFAGGLENVGAKAA